MEDSSRTTEDLRILAWMHAGERSPELLGRLHSGGFPDGMVLGDAPSRQAMKDALIQLQSDTPSDATATQERLAADYADIYLTHTLRASPYESVWRDEDHLMMQAPTFAVREFYSRHDMAVPNWRAMPDDHLAHELAFVATLLSRGERQAAQQFLDEHLLTWLPHFAARVSACATSPFYVALARLTLSCATQLRASLEA